MVVHAYYPMGETRVEREALALIDRGYEVDVICLGGREQPKTDSEDGVRIYRLPVRRHKNSGVTTQFLEYLAFFVLAFFKLTGLHLRQRYNVVQVHNLPDFLIFCALVPKFTGAQLILDLHDLMPEFYAARFDNGLASRSMRLILWQEKLSCRFADHVITVTELWREAIIERGIPKEKVSVVMNVADDRIFHRSSDSELPPRNDGVFRLIYHGTLTQRYGLDLAIRAVDRVRREINVHLTIHGFGPFLDSLKKLVDDLDLKEQVHFSTRGVPTSELPNLIRRADVAVVPYRRDVFTDGILPTKLMEYVALGIPVIAARTPAIEEYFDQTMVEFFAPGDADDLARHILALYADRDRRKQLIQNGDKFSQRYNWTAISAEYVTLVERLGA